METIKSNLNLCIPKLLSPHLQHIKYRCTYILHNIDKPWDHSTLSSIINGNDDIQPERLQEGVLVHCATIILIEFRIWHEINILLFFVLVFDLEIEYFESERGCMIVMRVQKLVESKCDPMAFRLCRQAIHAIRLCTDAHPLRHTVSVRQHQSLLETYFSLLYKFNKLEDIKVELNAMDAESAVDYIENSFISIGKMEMVIAKKKTTGSNSNASSIIPNKYDNHLYVNRLHKYHVRISQYALQYFLVKSLRAEHSDENSYMIQRLLRLWLDQHQKEPNFHDLFSKLVLNSQTKFQIYLCCETLYRSVSVSISTIKSRTIESQRSKPTNLINFDMYAILKFFFFFLNKICSIRMSSICYCRCFVWH